MVNRAVIPGFAAVAVCAAGLCIPATAQDAQNTRGAVEQSAGPVVPQSQKPAKPHLSAADREKLRQAVMTEHTEVEFQTAEEKPAKDFEPKIGEKLPPAIKPNGMPDKVLSELPQLRNFGYAKVKNQVLLVDATTGTIVDMIPETQPATTTGAK